MSDRRLARINHKFAALGVVGAVMVLLPMAQLLRYQSAEIQTLELQRASLDPMADAVALQRSLMAHGDASREVLQGRLKAEPLRLQRQAEVNRRLDELGHALAAGHWIRALEEARALAGDWAQLARQVADRGISVAQSDHAHRLRVEQALQVMDLLSLAWAPDLPGATGSSARITADLPHLAQRIATSTPQTDSVMAQAAAARLRALLTSLRGTLAPQADDALAAAVSQAEQRARQWQSAMGQPGADWLTARDLAVQAQLDLLVLARNHAASGLDERLKTAGQARTASVLALTALGVLALLLLQQLIRETTHRRRAPVPPPVPPPARAGRRLAESPPEAGRLIARLRRGASGDHATPAADTQPSLPPKR